MRIRTISVCIFASAFALAGCTTPSTSSEPTAASSTLSAQNKQSKGRSNDRQQLPDSSAKPEGFTTPPPGQGVERYLKQTVQWRQCGTLECGRVLVPLDWTKPDSQAITIAMKRRPAAQQPSLGTLFINPGGPGASAMDYVGTFPHKGLERYSIVGVDPRGSGESTPVVCGDGKQTDSYQMLDESPDNEQEKKALIDGVKKFAAQCWENSGELLKHVGSVNAIRDFDLIRQLLGEEKFTYLGVSYGTYLGALYAQMYPQNVGRLVLDAAFNISDSKKITQAQGFDRALNAFAEECAARSCVLGSTKEAVIETIVKFMNDLDENPLNVGDRRLTQSMATLGIGLFLYAGKEAYSSLETSLALAIARGNGTYLLQAYDIITERNKDGSYGPLIYALSAIPCRDRGDQGVDKAFEQWEKDKKDAPIFGKFFGPQVLCPLWAVEAEQEMSITGEGAPPIVVIGSTGDNATPYEYAVDMAQRLKSGVLLTRVGPGHGSYTKGNPCIEKAVQEYLNNGVVPADGMRCE